MKNFSKLSMVLFDSTNASFKLSVEANFTKTNPAGGFSPLVYVSQSGTANLNPNIYLLFQFKSETYDKGNSLYMSYPQLFRVREALESIKDLVANGSGFTTLKDASGERLVVKQEYIDPVVLTNIGKQSKWLSLKLVVMNTSTDGIAKLEPGVSIEISSANGYASVLSVEEFLTVYTIVKDLNLANLQAAFSLAFLDCDDFNQPQQMSGYNSGIYQQQPNPYGGQQRNPGQYPYGGQQRNPGQYQQPRYANGTAPAAQQPQRAAPSGRNISAQQPATPVANNIHSGNTNLPPRQDNAQSLMNLNAIENTVPAEELNIDINDDSALDDIFNEN